MTQNNTFTKVTLLIFQNHMVINPESLFVSVHAYPLRFDSLTHVDHIITQTHHALTVLLVCLSPRYELYDSATSAPASKEILIFCTVSLSLGTRIFIQHSLSETSSNIANTCLQRFALIFTILVLHIRF